MSDTDQDTHGRQDRERKLTTSAGQMLGIYRLFALMGIVLGVFLLLSLAAHHVPRMESLQTDDTAWQPPPGWGFAKMVLGRLVWLTFSATALLGCILACWIARTACLVRGTVYAVFMTALALGLSVLLGLGLFVVPLALAGDARRMGLEIDVF